MTDNNQSAKVKKTGYRGKKAKNPFGERIHREPFQRAARKPKEWRQIGDTVQVHVPIYKTGESEAGGHFPLAIPGDYGRYEGEQWLPLGVGDLCAIRFGDKGVAYLPDDGRWFTWVD